MGPVRIRCASRARVVAAAPVVALATLMRRGVQNAAPPAKRFISFVWPAVEVVVPTTIRAWHVNKRIADLPDDLDSAGHRSQWTTRLNAPGNTERAGVQLVYEQTIGALGALEAKAVGVLQAAALAATGAAVAATNAGLARGLGVVSLIYLAFAGAAAGWALAPRQREILVLDDLASSTGGFAEMAAASRMSEPYRFRLSNYLNAGVADLCRGGVFALAALAAFALI